MDEGATRIADRLKSTRQEVGGRLRELRYRARNAPWRSYYESNPWLFVAAAFAGGLLLSAAVGARRNSRMHDDGRLEGSTALADDSEARGQSSGTSEIWDRIRSALLAAAGAQLSSFLREIVPGLLGPHRSTADADASSARSPNGSDGSGEAEAL